MADFPGFEKDLEAIINKHSIDAHYEVPDHIIKDRIMRWLDSGMPEIELKNDPANLLTEAYRKDEFDRPLNEESRPEDPTPKLDIGSRLDVCGERFMVTDYHNSFDRPATATIMSVEEIQQAAQPPVPSFARRTRHRPYRGPQTSYTFQQED